MLYICFLYITDIDCIGLYDICDDLYVNMWGINTFFHIQFASVLQAVHVIGEHEIVYNGYRFTACY